jgi:hypothetical protein
MLTRTGRVESRLPIFAVVRIASLEHQGIVEDGVTQNLSAFGVRATVKNRWTPNEPVKVESPPGFFRSRGWVVYCQPIRDGNYAVGLRLLVRQPPWSPEGEREA